MTGREVNALSSALDRVRTAEKLTAHKRLRLNSPTNELTESAEPNMTTSNEGSANRLQQLHEQTIEALAKESLIEIDRVRSLYEAEHSRLLETARIKTYVPVIAARLVRIALHQSQFAVQ
jgi:hypothetical protein